MHRLQLAASMGTTQALHQFLTAHTNGSSSSSNNTKSGSEAAGGTTVGAPLDNISPDRSDSPGQVLRRYSEERRRTTGGSDSSAGGGSSSTGAGGRGTDEAGSSGIYSRGNYSSRTLQGPIVLEAVSSEDGSSSNSGSNHDQQSQQQRGSTAAV